MEVFSQHGHWRVGVVDTHAWSLARWCCRHPSCRRDLLLKKKTQLSIHVAVQCCLYRRRRRRPSGFFEKKECFVVDEFEVRVSAEATR